MNCSQHGVLSPDYTIRRKRVKKPKPVGGLGDAGELALDGDEPKVPKHIPKTKIREHPRRVELSFFRELQ